jgi:hypothetical protein
MSDATPNQANCCTTHFYDDSGRLVCAGLTGEPLAGRAARPTGWTPSQVAWATGRSVRTAGSSNPIDAGQRLVEGILEPEERAQILHDVKHLMADNDQPGSYLHRVRAAVDDLIGQMERGRLTMFTPHQRRMMVRAVVRLIGEAAGPLSSSANAPSRRGV